MSTTVDALKLRVFHRLGLGSALSAAALTAACGAPDAALDDTTAPSALAGLDEADSLDWQPIQDGASLVDPIDVPPYVPSGPMELHVGPAAVIHPLDFELVNGPPHARVRIDVDGPDGTSWTLDTTTDHLGYALFQAVTSPVLVGGDWLSARAEVDGAGSTNAVDFQVAPGVCWFNRVAGPGTVDLLANDLLVRVCEPLAADGSCSTLDELDAWDAHDMLVDNMQDVVPAPFQVTAECAETSIVTDCCYVARIEDPTVQDGWGGGGWGGYLGRPFTVGDQPTRSVPCTTSDWSAGPALDAASGLPRRVRRRLARMWASDALDEHASVASFARLALELMALGAPAELVAEATRAQADEIRHAERSFAIASHFADAPVGPGPLATADALSQHADLRAFTVAAVLEGCINETICASWAAEAARRAADPALSAVLAEIADDETRHAELSWALVRWILAAHPELADDVAEAVALFDPGPRPAAEPDARHLHAGGQLDDQTRHDLAQRVLAEVIRPATAALCHGSRLAA